MEIFHLLHIISLLVAIVGCNGALTPEGYWKAKLQSSSIPKSVRDLLSDADGQQVSIAKESLETQMAGVHIHEYTEVKYVNGYVIKSVATILAKDLHRDTKLNLEFTKTTSASKFLSRQRANSIPFSSSKFPQIFDLLSVQPDSLAAQEIKVTVTSCETTTPGEEKTCATSLESIIDFTISKLGKKVKAISTQVPKYTKSQNYKIAGFKKLGILGSSVGCHRLTYPYPVYYCHYTPNVQVYKITLMGDDGMKVKVASVCHVDKSKSTKVNTEAKNVPVCHLLPEDHIVWVPY